MAELKDILIKLIGDLGIQTLYSLKGKVTSVDQEAKTCTVEPMNGDADLLGVYMQAYESADTGIIIIPEVNSYVVVHFLTKDQAYITKTTGVSEVIILTSAGIKLNGDQYGGLIKIEELKTQIDKNTALLKSIQDVFKAWVPVPSDGGAALKTASSAFINLSRANLDDIENETVKHG